MKHFLPSEFIDLIVEDGILQYCEYFSDVILDDILEGLVWRNDFITMYGKTHPLPRLTAWYGEKGLVYKYSGIKMVAVEWTPILLKLKTQLENTLNTKFNSVLINYYRDGNDHMSYHSDNEKELGPDPVIASLSFGETRSFQLKHKFEFCSINSVSIVYITTTVRKSYNFSTKFNHFFSGICSHIT